MKTLLMSKCLLGENVRYDGGNCLLRADHISRLKHYFEILAVCPEVMAGFGIPREPIEILDGKIINKQGDDLTDRFDLVKTQIAALVSEHTITHALLKEQSPSCGVHQIYDGSFSGKIVTGQGIISTLLNDLGVQVFSEEEVETLLNQIK